MILRTFAISQVPIQRGLKTPSCCQHPVSAPDAKWVFFGARESILSPPSTDKLYM